MRIAATADWHFPSARAAQARHDLAQVRQEADLLVVAGDFTAGGRLDEMEEAGETFASLGLPVVAVLGNHDYDADQVAELTQLLERLGIEVLDGTAAVHEGVGVAGAKGFWGGFGAHTVSTFGEPEGRTVATAGRREAAKLDRALASLATPRKVAVVHYAPALATLQGEAPEVHSLMGSELLGEVIGRHGVALTIHGHAHHGTAVATAPWGSPVYNVALKVLQRETPRRPYRVLEV